MWYRPGCGWGWSWRSRGSDGWGCSGCWRRHCPRGWRHHWPRLSPGAGRGAWTGAGSCCRGCQRSSRAGTSASSCSRRRRGRWGCRWRWSGPRWRACTALVATPSLLPRRQASRPTSPPPPPRLAPPRQPRTGCPCQGGGSPHRTDC